MIFLRPASSRVQPGITLLESVLAVVLLGMVVASITSAVSYVIGMEGRSRKILAAHEIANRLILQHLSDEKKMPSTLSPIDYGPYSFTYEQQLSDVSMNVSQRIRQSAASNPNNNTLSRFQLLQITVYDAQISNSGQTLKGEALATLARIYDPIAARNPDVIENLGPESIQEMIRKILERFR